LSDLGQNRCTVSVDNCVHYFCFCWKSPHFLRACMKWRYACAVKQGEFCKVKNPLFEVCATSRTASFFNLVSFYVCCIFYYKTALFKCCYHPEVLCTWSEYQTLHSTPWYVLAQPRKRKHSTIKVSHFITFLKILLKSSHSLFFYAVFHSVWIARLSPLSLLYKVQHAGCSFCSLFPIFCITHPDG
jgi:hypothetical protein